MSLNRWQDSKYLFFLTTFLIPREINALPIMSAFDWKNLLGEEPLMVAEKLEKDGLLIRSNLATHLDHKYNSEELKGVLEQKKLSTTGKKVELILRLIDSSSEDVWSVFSDIKMLECSDIGTKMVHKYLLRHTSNPQLAFQELDLPSDKINEWVKLIKWVLVAALGGIIGNRADNALLSLIRKTVNVYPSVPTPTSSPVISPTPSPHPIQNQQPSSTPIIDSAISKPKYIYKSVTNPPPKPKQPRPRSNTTNPPRYAYGVIGEVVRFGPLIYGPFEQLIPGSIDERPILLLLLNHIEYDSVRLRASFIIKNVGKSEIAISPFSDFLAVGDSKFLGRCNDTSLPNDNEIVLAPGTKAFVVICWWPLGASTIAIHFKLYGSIMEEVLWLLRKEIAG